MTDAVVMTAPFPPQLTHRSGLARCLSWYPEFDMGFYPVEASPYDQSYWDRYVELAATPMGEALTDSRIDWVRQWAGDSRVVDVGIGCGQFIERRRALGGETLGYDINPVAVQWLDSAGLYLDPYSEPVEAITAWDVLEHIHNPAALLQQVTRWVFATIPVVESAEQALRSKHYKPKEHCWYWTHSSFPAFMRWYGFQLVDTSTFEVELGREQVMTFTFERISSPC